MKHDDIGIWPESESFGDKAMGPIPSRWNGTCAAAQDFNTSNCNKKIIGARSYDIDERSVIRYHSPRDMVGHGTHVASTAAGSEVQAYWAFDDAIADGVDVLSISLGSPSFLKPQITDDPIALGAFHAVQNGITVVCSAGNDGPEPGSVVNAAPWIMTVAASTIDRDFESDVILGDNTVIKVVIIFLVLFLVFYLVGFVASFNPYTGNFISIHQNEMEGYSNHLSCSRNCHPDSLDQELVKGKIVVCENVDNLYSPSEKKDEVKKLGGVGAVVIDDESRQIASSYGTFPTSVIRTEYNPKVISYINLTKNPVATILRTTSPTNYTPAPTIAYFSSRGPSTIPKNILKPDIAAPGVNILAAWIANDTAEAPEGKEPPLYNVISGTSMACPHVSGIAATVKSKNPTWSPSAIRSAIMTTATQINNLKAPITTEKGTPATPNDFGAGEVSPTGPLEPGLVYETTAVDYLNFLCYHGYNITTIKNIAKTVPEGFTCPEESSIDLISNINYPSIAISNFNEKAGRKVNRTLTNVAGDGKSVYTVSIDAPADLDVQVIPNKLQFTKNGDKSSYQVSFSTANPLKKDAFGSITWSNGKYKVRSPFAVSSKSNE
ncbi:CO(2)-response secreted protease [Hibiscus syriacus]|uniref:CO(2)-response secreted protease n=1 Tax=Hibiscus syriacus TaxID=106335 RepID=A0A6A3CP93_HIBSY|nr:CO(2)-response secreted protease [Hibiscus syriacus]